MCQARTPLARLGTLGTVLGMESHQTQSDPAREWLSPEQLADLLGVSRHTIYKWSSRGEVPAAVRLPNGSLRFHRAAVVRWLAERAA